jgi:hypothetical protein
MKIKLVPVLNIYIESMDKTSKHDLLLYYIFKINLTTNKEYKKE